MKKTLISICFCIFTISSSFCNNGVRLYPAPESEQTSKDFKVSINKQSLFVYQARVSAMPINHAGGIIRPLEQTELVSFGYFDASGKVNVVIESNIPVQNIVIRPLSKKIKPDIQGNKISFQLAEPCQLAVEVNDSHHVLYLFANPPEENPLKNGSGDVIYFGPGMHSPGIIRVKDNQTIYVAGGAVVHGIIDAENVRNITIKGRGIIDGSTFTRDQANIIHLLHCENVHIEGVILRDSPTFAVAMFGSRKLFIDNIKLIGMWRYNTDGIDPINCRDVQIKNSFLRTFDDCIAVKGVTQWHKIPGKWGMEWQGPKQDYITNITVDNCVLWCDWGRALEIGAETSVDSICHCFFRNCDIIRNHWVAMDIQQWDRANVYDIHFENIRVEASVHSDTYYDSDENPITNIHNITSYSGIDEASEMGRLFEINIRHDAPGEDSIRGKVHNIFYENITSDYLPKSFFKGENEKSNIYNISFRNIQINRKRVSTIKEGNIIPNEYAIGFKFQ